MMKNVNPFTITFGKQPNRQISRYEDVDKIRNYTLSSEHLKEKLQEEAEFSRKQKEADEQFTWKDVFAMTIAIIQVILPYMLIMFAVMVLTFLFFYWRAHS